MFIKQFNQGTGHISLAGVNFSATSGSWTFANSSTYTYYTSFLNSSNTNGDKATTKVYLAAGTYQIKGMVLQYASAGIQQITIQSDILAETTIMQNDLYAVASNFAYLVSGSFTVSQPGLYTLTIIANGKNASSGGYVVGFQKLALVRTS